MPTVQVLNRIDDNSVKTMNDTGDSIVDSMRKAQAMNMTKQYYGILAKNAENEHEKASNQKLADWTQFLAGAKDVPPENKAAYIKMGTDAYFGGNHDASIKATADVSKTWDKYQSIGADQGSQQQGQGGQPQPQQHL